MRFIILGFNTCTWCVDILKLSTSLCCNQTEDVENDVKLTHIRCKNISGQDLKKAAPLSIEIVWLLLLSFYIFAQKNYALIEKQHLWTWGVIVLHQLFLYKINTWSYSKSGHNWLQWQKKYPSITSYPHLFVDSGGEMTDRLTCVLAWLAV